MHVNNDGVTSLTVSFAYPVSGTGGIKLGSFGYFEGKIKWPPMLVWREYVGIEPTVDV